MTTEHRANTARHPTPRLGRRLHRAAILGTLAMALWVAGVAGAQAQTALIMNDAGGNAAAIGTHLTSYLTAAGYTVTAVTVLPGSLTTYAQVWDVRYNNVTLSGGEVTTYSNYLSGGGSLFLMGENQASFSVRNNSLRAFVSTVGGGTLTQGADSGVVRQTVLAPFNAPNAVASVRWAGAGKVTTPANGSFITTDGVGGTALVFSPGTLTTAATGTLIVVFDVNILLDNPGTTEPDLLILLAKNIIAYLAAPTPITPPSSTPTPAPGPTPAGAPTITSIPTQLIGVSSSATVSFTVGGSVIFDALTVAASSSNTTFAQTLTLTKLDSNGHWTLQVFGEDGRFGSAVITVTVSDPSRNSTSTSFTVATAGTTGGPGGSLAVPTAPGNLVASASGSGVALTWSTPGSGAPGRYVVSGGTAPGASDVSVFVTPDASTSYVISMIPPGTYYFRVRAASDALGPASNEASVTATGSTVVMGVPTGALSTANGSDVTVTWNVPFGPSPPLYLIEFGTTAGGSDVALVTAVNPTYTRSVRAGLSFMRVRSYNGGMPSGPSNETSIAVGLGGCSAPPFVPVLLPAAVSGRVVTFSWLPPASWQPDGATSADSYRIDVTSSSGTVTSVPTAGAGTSATWSGAAGSYTAQVTALNRCGGSTPSAGVTFVQP